MSLVFDRRDVYMARSTLAFSGSQDKQRLVPCFSGYGDGNRRENKEIHPSVNESEKGDALSESSSIGVPSDGDDDGDDGEEEEEEEEVQSKSNRSLCSLVSLEDSLPIKRGLSNYFSGKSKSFANLSEVSTMSEIEKKENPLNKRRRITIAYNWSKKSSLYGWKSPTSMPLLSLNEQRIQEEDDDEDSSKEEEDERNTLHDLKLHRRLNGFKSCFSFTDLQK